MKQFAKEIAEELNVKPEVVSKAIYYFWFGIRHYIANPFEVKAGVLLSDFMYLKLNYKRLKWLKGELDKIDYVMTPRQESAYATVNDLIEHYEYWQKGNGKGTSREKKKNKKPKNNNEQQT